jgi:flagellar motor switch protein FliN/FliY
MDSVHPAEHAVAGAEQAAQKVTDAMSQAVSPEIPDLSGPMGPEHAESIGLLEDVQLQVRIELGRTRMLVEDVLRLGSGAVVELDKAAGDPVDIYVNGRRIARGEVLVLNENFCVRVSEIVDSQAMSA